MHGVNNVQQISKFALANMSSSNHTNLWNRR